jgi:hypothetical protein
MASKNCSVVTTFTETVAGEIVTLMLVTGSVQVETEVDVELVGVLVVQVIAVLTGAAPQETRLAAAPSNAKTSSSFTAPCALPDSHFIPLRLKLFPKLTNFCSPRAGQALRLAIPRRTGLKSS